MLNTGKNDRVSDFYLQNVMNEQRIRFFTGSWLFIYIKNRESLAAKKDPQNALCKMLYGFHSYPYFSTVGHLAGSSGFGRNSGPVGVTV